MTNNINNSIISAISTIVQKAVDNIEADTTHVVTVKRLVDTERGEYKVGWSGGDCTAYSLNGNVYKPQDTVYMKVPKNNWSEKKVIEGLVSVGKTTYGDIDSFSHNGNDYSSLGGSVLTDGEKEVVDITIEASKTEKNNYCWYSNDYPIDIAEEGTEKLYPSLLFNKGLIDSGLIESDALLIKARVTTEFSSGQIISSNGLYGLIFGIVYKNSKGEEYIENLTFSSQDMTGNPLSLTDSEQYKLFEIKKDNFVRFDYVISYSKNFNSDSGKVIFRNLDIEFVKRDTIVNGDYSIKLSAPSGDFITSQNENQKLKLQVKCYYKGSDITDGCIFYWGKEDISIKETDSKYNSKLGKGWKQLNSSSNTLFINSTELYGYRNNFKVAAVYKTLDSVIDLVSEKALFNNSKKIYAKIDSSKGTEFKFGIGETVLTCKVYADKELTQPLTNYRYVWSKEDENGTVVFDTTEQELEKEKQEYLNDVDEETGLDSLGRNKFQINHYYRNAIDEIKNVTHGETNVNVYGDSITVFAEGLSTISETIFKCTIQEYGISGYSTIGQQTISLTNKNSDDTTLTATVYIHNGNQLFQYDEVGRSPKFKDENFEFKKLIAELFDENGATVKPENWDSVVWKIPTEETLIKPPKTNFFCRDNEYCYQKDENYEIDIVDSYDSQALNNQITCEIIYNGETYNGMTNFLFTKVGENGTNGTSTVLKIEEYTEGLEPGCHLALMKEGGEWHWNNKNINELNLPYSAKLYYYNEGFDKYDTKWTFAGTGSNSKYFKTVKTKEILDKCNIEPESNPQKEDVRILSAMVDVDGKTYSSSCPFYTIEYIDNNNSETYPIGIKTNSLQYVTYSSGGTDPQFNTSNGGVFLSLGKKSMSVLWKAMGGIETDAGTNPAFSLSNVPGIAVGSTNIDQTEENSDAIKHVREDIIVTISTTKASIKDKDVKDRVTAVITAIENEFKGTLTNGMALRVKNSNDILASFETELDKSSATDYDKKQCGTIITTFREFFKEVNGEVEKSESTFKESNRVYTKILNILDQYQEKVAELSVTNDDTRRDYVVRVKYFWTELIRNIKSEIVSDENSQKYLEALSLYSDKVYNEIIGSDSTGAAQVCNNNLDFFNKFKSQFVNMTIISKGITSNYGEIYINMLKTNDSISEGSSQEASVYIVPADRYNGAYCNNRVVAEVYDNGNKVAIVTIPIHFNLNFYELSSVNGWDGNSVEINEDDGYVLAPQICAGTKNSRTNTFTGIALGSLSNKTETGYSDEKVGLMGFADGQQSIFLDAKTGSALFGLTSFGSDANSPYTEGRIKLVPGGVSEISRWKIGRDSIYNVVEGDVEDPYERIDSAVINAYGRNGSVLMGVENTSVAAPDGAKKSIPHDKQGIMLSAEPAYIAVKGRPLTVGYGDNYDVDNSDGKSIILDGDTFEVEIDPNAKSLFTIYRHTQTADGIWYREPKVGFNNKGQFYSNSLANDGTSLEISTLGAFGKFASQGSYVGVQINCGAPNDEEVPVLKLFTDNADTSEGFKNSPIYISGGFKDNNEYSRPMHLYGEEIKLFASPLEKSNDIESKCFISLGKCQELDEVDKTNKEKFKDVSLIQIKNNENTLKFKEDEVRLIANNAIVNASNGIAFTIKDAYTLSFKIDNSQEVGLRNPYFLDGLIVSTKNWELIQDKTMEESVSIADHLNNIYAALDAICTAFNNHQHEYSKPSVNGGGGTTVVTAIGQNVSGDVTTVETGGGDPNDHKHSVKYSTQTVHIPSVGNDNIVKTTVATSTISKNLSN